jgi:sulfite reductase alpha subunit-like flavoprotein
VIFLVSTSGQGELPANMRKNWRKLLNARIPANWLSSLKIACFGLGDSSYQKYNFAVKKLARRLSQLGADQVLSTALGDDQHELGPYALFDQFVSFIWKYLVDNSIFEVSLICLQL